MIIYPAIPKCDEYLYPNREEDISNINSLINLIQNTYFKKYELFNSNVIFDSLNNNNFCITFHIDFLNDEIASDIIGCPLLKMTYYGITSYNKNNELNIYGNINDIINSINKFPKFIINYNKDVKTINKFNL